MKIDITGGIGKAVKHIAQYWELSRVEKNKDSDAHKRMMDYLEKRNTKIKVLIEPLHEMLNNTVQIGNFNPMKQLIEIDASSPEGKRLLQILRNIEQQGVVNFLDEGRLKDSDWIRSGRPATDAELENLVQEMNTDTGEYSIDEVVSHVNEELQRWRTKGE